MQNEKRLSRSQRYKRRIQGLVAEVTALRALLDEHLALLPSDQLTNIHNRLIEIHGELPFDGENPTTSFADT